MKRKTTAFLLAVFLLIGGFAYPVGAQVHLVCRLSGQPMSAVWEKAPDAAKTAPCCRVARTSFAASAWGIALRPGSCCDLRVSTTGSRLAALSDSVLQSFGDTTAVLPLRAPTGSSNTFTRDVAAALFLRRFAPPPLSLADTIFGRAPPFPGFS